MGPPPPTSSSSSSSSSNNNNKFWSATRIQIPIKQPQQPATGTIIRRAGSSSSSGSSSSDDNKGNSSKTKPNKKSSSSSKSREAAAAAVEMPTMKTSSTNNNGNTTPRPPKTQTTTRTTEAKKAPPPLLPASGPTAATAAGVEQTTTATTNVPSPSSLLFKTIKKSLQKQSLNFKINVECTSMCLSPSGHFLWAGFSDGTLRVFDLTGTFGGKKNKNSKSQQQQGQGQGQSSSDAASSAGALVNSKDARWQSYGAVACQIHARGVHTDLQTTVDVSPDGRFVFFGVQRGAVELYAVDVSLLEQAVIGTKQRWIDAKIRAVERGEDHTEVQIEDSGNILDYLQVYCHSDAKLKGFGACTNMQQPQVVMEDGGSGSNPSYFLLTGKGIKNIHIWKFSPPTPPAATAASTTSRGKESKKGDNDDDGDDDNGTWEQLYDTPTNGNTIILLDFYRTAQGKLLAVSKSDSQKLRLWDLSEEDKMSLNDESRPKRPPYQDVANSQAALGIAGSLCVCGGESMFNQLSIVSLDQPKNAYNHTELALPTGSSTSTNSSDGQAAENPSYSSSRRFQRRGEMKAIVNAATLRAKDSSHYALLELDDGSLVQYSSGTTKGTQSNDSRLTLATPETTGIPGLPADFWHRSICLANVSGVVVAAASMYNANTSKGRIVIRALEGLNSKKSGKISPKSSPMAKSRSRPTPKSPMAADTQALRHAVEAPPRSEPRRMISRGEDANQKLDSKPAAKSSNKVRVSPEQQPLTTPCRQETVASSSPEDNEPVPLISTVLKPKRIDQPGQKKKEAKQPANTQTQMETPSASNKDKAESGPSVVVTDKKKKSTTTKPAEKKERKGIAASKKPSSSSSDVVTSKAKAVVVTDKKAKKQKRRQAPATKPEVASTSIPAFPNVTTTIQATETKEDVDTAMLLASLNKTSNSKPSITPSKTGGPGTAASGTVTVTTSSAAPPSSSSISPRPSSLSKAKSTTQNPSRDDLILEQIRVHYKNLHTTLHNLSTQSSSLMQERISKGPLVSLFAPTANDDDGDHFNRHPNDAYTEQYSTLMREHKAGHILLQRRILRAAEATVRILLDGEVTLEDARNDLNETIKVHEEILYDTLRRQEFERSALVAQFPREAAANASKEASSMSIYMPTSDVHHHHHHHHAAAVEEYPCQLAFQRVQDICSTIKRPVGRPRSGLLN